MVPDHAERLPLTCDPNELAFLGPSVCLYFTIVKYMLVFMCIPLVGAVACAGINLATCGFNAIPECLESDDTLFIQECIHCGVWVMAALYYPLSFLRFLKNSITLLLHKLTAADYTVKVSGIARLTDPNDLRRYLQTLMQDRVNVRPEIDAVFPAYDIRLLGSIQKKLDYWEKTLFRLQRGLHRRCYRWRLVTEDICRVRIHEYKSKKNRVFEDIDEEEASVAFVAFKYPQDARRFIDSFSQPYFIQLTHFLRYKLCRTTNRQRHFNQMPLTYKRPSHPEDICFENLSIPFSKRLKKQAVTIILAILILGGAGLILFSFRYVQKEINGDDDDLQAGSLLASLMISVVLLLVNLALEVVMAVITKAERHPSDTAYKTSVARKLITLMFLNTAIVPTVVSAYIGNDETQRIWFTSSRFWLDVYVIVTVNAICPPLFYFYLFNPLWLMWTLMKRHLRSSLRQNNVSLLQPEANAAYTPPELDLSERFAQVVKTLYVGLFFSPIVPLSLPLSMLGIALDYWVTKFMLLRKHPKPKYHNEKLGLEMKEWMRYSLVIYAVGISFFYFKLGGNLATDPEIEAWYKLEVLSVIAAVTGFVYLCIPINFLIKEKKFNRLIEEKMRADPMYQAPYRLKRLEFNTDFERRNPALRRRARFIFEEDKLRAQSCRASETPVTFEGRSVLDEQYRQLAPGKRDYSKEEPSSFSD